MKNQKLIIGIAIVALALLGVGIAGANPSVVINSSGTTCRSASATSSVSYMTAGTATTTVSCDLFALGAGSADALPKDLFVRVYQTASSTNSAVASRFEWSDDNITWYADSALTTTDVASSSFMVGDYKEYKWIYASTTPGAGVIGTSNTGGRTFSVPVRARYVRGMFYVPTGNAASGLWVGYTGLREESSR